MANQKNSAALPPGYKLDPPSQATLAQVIRAKYPGSYDDLDDPSLEKQVLAKYPQYSDMPQTALPPGYTLDPSQDKDFLAASPPDQHSYLMDTDPDYAKASPADQQGYLAHIRAQSATPPSGFTGLIGDPDFQKLDPASQRQALMRVSGDQSFANLSDSDTQQFISRMGGKAGQQPQAQPNPWLQGAEDVGIGVGKGALNTVSGVSTLLNKLPWVGKYLAPPQGISAMQQISRPTDTAQKVGYYGEQAAEFLAPGLGEEDAALAGAKALPWLGKAGPMLGRLAMNTAASGAINKLQGGDFSTGAAAGAGSGLLGEGVRALAPTIAESALGVTQRMRGYGKTIGQAALDETSGLTPGAIANSASQRISALTGQLNSLANASQTTASLKPALDVLDQAETVARARNSSAMLGKINAVRDQLTTDITSGQAIPQDILPGRLLDLKRGIGELATSWAPQDQKGIQPLIKRVYGALDSELDRTVPGAQGINQTLSSLIPARTRANVLSNSAPLLQKVAGRAAAHTGALAGAGIGSVLGYEKGGTGGALAGGLTGLVAPELLASPTAQMATARIAQNAPAILPWLVGPGLQASRKGAPQLPWLPPPPEEPAQPVWISAR